jgi:hypothetical protein
MHKYAIKNPTIRKVKNRGWEPVYFWLDNSGEYVGWRVKVGTKHQHIFRQNADYSGTVKKFPLKTFKVRDIK